MRIINKSKGRHVAKSGKRSTIRD